MTQPLVENVGWVGLVILGTIAIGALAQSHAHILVIGLVATVALDLCSKWVALHAKVIQDRDLNEPEFGSPHNAPPPTPGRYTGRERKREPKWSTPSFKSSGMDSQLQEMTARFKPKREAHQAVKGLAKLIDGIITSELQIHGVVTGFAYASPFVESPMVRFEPEISISVTVDLAKHHAWLKENVQTQADCTLESSSKNILRRIKKCLLTKHPFTPRRLIFAENARIVVVAPFQNSRSPKRACMQLAINDPLPGRGAKLMAFCDKFEPLASDLVLLVQQWARWRAICLVDKGDLHFYVWTMLVIFYMQITGLLPPYVGNAKGSRRCTARDELSTMRTHLFKGFFSFYNREFDFNTEAVSVSKGRRCSKNSSCAPLCIEDPFDAECDPTRFVLEKRIHVLKQELQRGDHLCSSCADLSELFACPEDEHE